MIQGAKKGPDPQAKYVEMLHREMLELEEKAEIAPTPKVLNALAAIHEALRIELVVHSYSSKREIMGSKNSPAGYA